MIRPNTLLKVVSILMIVFSCIAIVLTLLASTFAGSLVSMLYDAAGIQGGASAGLLTGSALFVVAIVGSVFHLAAGILGVKAKFTGCKVLGIISLVCGCLSLIVTLFMGGTSSAIVSAVAGLVLPVLYVWGAFKGPQAQ